MMNKLGKIMGAFSVKIDHIKYDAVQKLEAMQEEIQAESVEALDNLAKIALAADRRDRDWLQGDSGQWSQAEIQMVIDYWQGRQVNRDQMAAHQDLSRRVGYMTIIDRDRQVNHMSGQTMLDNWFTPRIPDSLR